MTTSTMKDGRVLVKRTIPLPGGTEAVQKTVYQDQNAASLGPVDAMGGTVTVHSVKDGRILVKKVISLEDGTEAIQKTVYPDQAAAAENGFVLDA